MNRILNNINSIIPLGRLLYNSYYRPKGFLEKSYNRGFYNTFIDFKEKKRMEKSVFNLTSIETRNKELVSDICFLTGSKYWYQTCFCAYSFLKYANISITPVIHSDGTLKKHHIDKIKSIFPQSRFVKKEEINEKIHRSLHPSKYPALAERRQNLNLMRKIIDVHILGRGWKLFLDSDMLFFNEPTQLIKWLKNPQSPLCMNDVIRSYGYDIHSMKDLAGGEIPDRINTGVFGFNSDFIDWDKLEFWCRELIDRYGTHYYQEQALTAMLISNTGCDYLPESEYIVKPDRDEVISPTAKMHHYVADSKPWYFRYGWKHIFDTSKN